MTRIALAMVLASVLLTACSKDNGATDSAKVEPAAAAACPAANESGVIEIEPGLTATVINKGYGRKAASGDYADVHTTLWLYDETAEGGRGEEIWSSGGTNPFQFQLGKGQVIKGWDMGIPCMLLGETRELIVAGDLAYGSAGRAPIPPNATLLFNIKLVALKAPE